MRGNENEIVVTGKGQEVATGKGEGPDHAIGTGGTERIGRTEGVVPDPENEMQ